MDPSSRSKRPRCPSWTVASCSGTEFTKGIGVLDGRLIDNEAHLERLERSLAEVRIPNPYSKAEWTPCRKNSSAATA